MGDIKMQTATDDNKQEKREKKTPTHSKINFHKPEKIKMFSGHF